MDVTFETKCYFGDWQFVVKKVLVQQMIENCNFPFNKKVLFINNFPVYDEVKRESDKLISRNIIDEYVIVEEHAKDALDFFGTSTESFKGGYYYSIAELVSIYLCKTEFLLHFSSDSIMKKSKTDWIGRSIQLMDSNPHILVTNPVWNSRFDEASSEAFREDVDWYYSYGFSDQAYFIRAKEFQKPIYNEMHPDSERYPAYGGELFEKRVDSYMRNNSLVRATCKDVVYEHKNFQKSSIRSPFRFHFSFKTK